LLDIPDPESVEPFLDQVVEQFKNQRMCSPPPTAHLTITVAGKISAERFRELWFQRCANDPILKHFMSIMVRADILHIQGRELLDHASLIAESPGAKSPDPR
jgi:hypothetical protein